MDRLLEAKRVFETEIEALQDLKNAISDDFLGILDTIVNCKGKVVVTGIGKSGIIARKVASTMASLGTDAYYMHPTDALHGDLGIVSSKDVVIVFSKSGETREVLDIIPALKLIGATIIGITNNNGSMLAKLSDIVQIMPNDKEACHLGLAPTTSTTMQLVYGDALAIVTSIVNGFNDDDFGKIHPAGALGKRVTYKVKNIMKTGEKNAFVNENVSLKDAIVELSKKGLGLVCVVGNDMSLKGVITEGDIRRQLEKEADIYSFKATDIMTVRPHTIAPEDLAIIALQAMNKNNISAMPVVDGDILVGTIRLQDLVSAGLVL
jgi:arabinose-5-phosphate isomerase